ncbi:MAG TPA: hypothetical protein VD713_00770 [Sphingomonadales bacterium]|nr:hypothetical protein [Sphingomonadales bacterium]
MAVSFLLSLGFFPSPVRAEETLSEALRNGKLLFDGRLRYEHVEQANFAEDANALTFRARFGFETAPFKGFKILAEGDFTRALGINDYNSTVNGKTGFPVIADPASARLNRASLSYVGLDKFTVAAGRQRIILDDARFVGNVGFRQNEQTFDSVTLKTNRLKDVTLTYAFVWRVNRISGSRSPAGHANGGSHLLNVSYAGLPFGTLTAYAYLIGLDTLPASSSQTYGARLRGEQTAGAGVKILYTAGFARQTDYKLNPASYALSFIELEGGFSYKDWVAKAGLQKLSGNGAASFQTPLATLHAFQGFADQFLTTPAAGVRDVYAIAGYRRENVGTFGTVTAMVWFHDFSPVVAGPDLGEEVDFLISSAPRIAKRVYVFSVKAARFFGSPVMPNVTKLWLTAEVAF